ncbi:unnamed protein product [Diamesa hyperborea]
MENCTTPPIMKSFDCNLLGDSWIDLSTQLMNQCPDRVTPPLPFSSGDEYLRLLKEAQRDSNNSSRISSRISSRRDSPKGSPKSPPNSPNPELTNEEELKGIYINYWIAKDQESTTTNTTNTTDNWMWEWSSRPDQQPPKDWKFEHPVTKKEVPKYSMRLARVGNIGLFSKEVMYSLVITNVLSILLGTGIGVWLTKRGYIFTRLAIE